MTDQTTKHDEERAEVDRQLHYWYQRVHARCERNPLCSDHEAAEIRVIVNGLRTRYSALTHGKAWHPRVTITVALALFLAITTTPAGCSITGHTSEGFPVATCEDGTTIYQDMDGAGGYDSGLPYVTPGTWVPIG